MFYPRWFLAMAMLVVISTTFAAPPSSAQGVDLLKQALETEKAGNKTAALGLYTSAIQAGDLTRAQLALAYYRKGGIRGALGDNSLGIEDFSRSIEHNPAYGEALSLRGYLRGVIGQYDLAERDHHAAIKLADQAKWPNYLPWTLQHMADVLRRRGDFGKALEYCDRALQNSSYAPVLLRRAWINMDKGDTARAKIDFAAFQRAAEEQKIPFDIFWPDEREAFNRLSRL